MRQMAIIHIFHGFFGKLFLLDIPMGEE